MSDSGNKNFESFFLQLANRGLSDLGGFGLRVTDIVIRRRYCVAVLTRGREKEAISASVRVGDDGTVEVRGDNGKAPKKPPLTVRRGLDLATRYCRNGFFPL
jgi:hypothetical protein